VAAERLFRAMGSDAHVVVVGGPDADDLVGMAVARIERLEARWSRFRDDSEVSELNRRSGSAVRVSPETVELVRRAVEGWWLSGGAFDPTVLGAVLRAGYDRSFETLGDNAPPHPANPLGPGAPDIVVGGDTVALPAAVGFDPGGIGKGLAADMVVAELRAAGAEGACVNLGGDVAVSGTGPEGGGWTVAVEHELRPEPLAHLGLSAGAVTTSSTLRRRWRRDGKLRHHLVDPRTGEPSDSDLDHVTVVAGSAWVAEVLGKAVLLRGSTYCFDILGGTGAEALAVTTSGTIRSTPGLAAYLGGAELPAGRSVLAG
jgi:thiamine biosynthesis lipoprotein